MFVASQSFSGSWGLDSVIGIIVIDIKQMIVNKFCGGVNS